MAIPTKAEIDEGRQAFLNIGLGPLVNAVCYFVGAWVALTYFNPYDAKISTIAVFAGAVASPLLMLIVWGRVNAGFATILSVSAIALFLALSTKYSYSLYEVWFNVNAVGLIIGAIWFLVLFASTKITINKYACITCNGVGTLTHSSYHLNAHYIGSCYVCLGKKDIKKSHPHYEASQILNQYNANIIETQKEFENLKATFEEMGRQKRQGAEALGQALYQQTLELENKYHDQAALRLTQIQFFEQGLRKLHRMMYNSMLADNMLTKQKELAELYDDNAKDLGSVMSLKAQLEMHTDVIDRINALSTQIDMHSSTSIAAELSKEIEEMQAGL